MIHATKAVRTEVSDRIDYERFEALLSEINIQDYGQDIDELFVTFECIEEEAESSFDVGDGIIYLIVRLPYAAVAQTEEPFKLLIDGFLRSLTLLEGILDVERLSVEVRERLGMYV